MLASTYWSDQDSEEKKQFVMTSIIHQWCGSRKLTFQHDEHHLDYGISTRH